MSTGGFCKCRRCHVWTGVRLRRDVDARMVPEVPEVGGKAEGSHVSLALGAPEVGVWGSGWVPGALVKPRLLVMFPGPRSQWMPCRHPNLGYLGCGARPRLPPESGCLAGALEALLTFGNANCFLQFCL